MHRVLVIGTGSIGERHVRCLLRTGRATVGICEINEALRGQVASRYAIAESFSGLDDALRAKWDSAFVATPAHTHIPIAARLVSEGVHILVEKPLSTSLDGVEELIRLVRAKHRVAAVAYVYRSHPGFAAMREAVRSGRFGKPVEVVAMCGQHFPTYRPAYRQIYYTNRAHGGGAIQDAITHVLNAMEWVVGPIERLVADAAHQVLEGVTVEDTVHILTRHGGTMGSFSLNQHQAANECTLTVIAERGMARFELHENRWRWKTDPKEDWHDEPFPPMERDDWFVMQANGFLDALEGKRDFPCSLEEGRQTLKVCLAALRSSDTGSGWMTVENL
jgi:predicted dehydrogenase